MKFDLLQRGPVGKDSNTALLTCNCYGLISPGAMEKNITCIRLKTGCTNPAFR